MTNLQVYSITLHVALATHIPVCESRSDFAPLILPKLTSEKCIVSTL